MLFPVATGGEGGAGGAGGVVGVLGGAGGVCVYTDYINSTETAIIAFIILFSLLIINKCLKNKRLRHRKSLFSRRTRSHSSLRNKSKNCVKPTLYSMKVVMGKSVSKK